MIRRYCTSQLSVTVSISQIHFSWKWMKSLKQNYHLLVYCFVSWILSIKWFLYPLIHMGADSYHLVCSFCVLFPCNNNSLRLFIQGRCVRLLYGSIWAVAINKILQHNFTRTWVYWNFIGNCSHYHWVYQVNSHLIWEFLVFISTEYRFGHQCFFWYMGDLCFETRQNSVYVNQAKIVYLFRFFTMCLFLHTVLCLHGLFLHKLLLSKYMIMLSSEYHWG